MDFQDAIMRIITNSSEAKYYCFEAIRAYKSKDFIKIKNDLVKASDLLALASQEHLKILQHEVNTNQRDYSLLMIHAEDILLTTTTLKEFLNEFLID